MRATVLLATLTALAAADARAQAVSLPRGDDRVAALGERSPQRNGAPYLCFNLLPPGRTRVVVSGAFPVRLDLYETADCSGTPRLSRAGRVKDDAVWAEADTGVYQRRSVGISSADATRGIFVLKSDVGGGRVGAASEVGVVTADDRQATRVGSLSSPLPPGPVHRAPGFESTNEYCRAAHGAIAAYRDSRSAQRIPLSNLSAAEHRRRRNLFRVEGETARMLADARESLFSSSLVLFTTPFATSEDSKTQTTGIMLTAAACDQRLGLTPITNVVSR
ncbi:hypothetical protein ACO2Q1_03330 [Brevundimonas sp. VNH65]|uniref:hypothetical protein n=1 Tax=Brevundimonas sp. VNH65 TaxID=3400917 RepID=UPI003C065400